MIPKTEKDKKLAKKRTINAIRAAFLGGALGGLVSKNGARAGAAIGGVSGAIHDPRKKTEFGIARTGKYIVKKYGPEAAVIGGADLLAEETHDAIKSQREKKKPKAKFQTRSGLPTGGTQLSARPVGEDEDLTGKRVSRPVSFFPIAKHYGVGVGKNKVAHSGRGFPLKVEDRKTFGNNSKIRVHDRKAGDASPSVVKKRAAKLVGKTGAYNTVTNNCEHIANKIVSGKKKSHQVNATAVGAGLASTAIGAVAIARRNLRGKKPSMGIRKTLMSMFADRRRTIDLDPTKKGRDIAVGTGAVAAGAGVAYAGHRIGKAANKVGKAADIAEKLGKHVGGHVTHTADKINSHIDYVGQRTADAVDAAKGAANAGKRTASAYHPRVIRAALKKKLPFLAKYLSAVQSTTEFQKKNPNKERSWVDRNGARIVGGALALGGSLYVAAKYHRPITKVAHAGDQAVRGAAPKPKTPKKPSSPKQIGYTPKEKTPRTKRVLPPITDIKKVKRGSKSRKKNMGQLFQKITSFVEKQGHESGTGRFGTMASVRPAYRAAQKHARVTKRGGEVAQDISDHLRGVPKDPRKKRFWEKEWFKTLAISGGIGAGILAHRVHAKSKGINPLFSVKVRSNNFASPGFVKAAVEGAIDAVGLGGATSPGDNGGKKKKKKTTAELQAESANPDPGQLNGAFFTRNHRILHLARLIQFYGTSDGVTKSWDTRGRSAKTAKTPSWWTHSPTANSVRVVRSPSESGPRTRRGKKPHERSSFLKKALAVTSGLAVAGTTYGLVKRGQLNKLRKSVNTTTVSSTFKPSHGKATVIPTQQKPPAPIVVPNASPTGKPEALKKTRKSQAKNRVNKQNQMAALIKVLRFGAAEEYMRNVEQDKPKTKRKPVNKAIVASGVAAGTLAVGAGGVGYVHHVGKHEQTIRGITGTTAKRNIQVGHGIMKRRSPLYKKIAKLVKR